MSHRLIASLIAALVATACHAEPLRWTYRTVNQESVRVFEESGLSVTSYVGGAGRPEPVWTDEQSSEGWVKSATSTEVVTITDEASGQQATASVWWTIRETWEPHFDENGKLIDLEPISYGQYFGPEVRYDNPYLHVLGRNEYRIWTDQNLLLVEVRADVVDAPTETPEPGTLILGGIAVAGGVGAWVRKRRRG
jgi:hypothetical protein